MQAPSLTSFIAVVIFIAGIGVALDKLILSSRLDAWRRNIAKLWVKLNTPGAKALAQDANQLYCDLFDYIYGARAFTWRRVWASILSSIIGLLVITLLLGYENTFFHILEHVALTEGETFVIPWPVLSLVVFSVCIVTIILNLIPDFFSLMETRLVLNWSKHRGPLGIFFLIILDLILTTVIFLVGALVFPIAYVLIVNVTTIMREPGGFFRAFFEGIFSLLWFNPRYFLVFYLTTFVTSFFWILFVITFGLIWVFHRLSPLANLVYYQIGQSDRPAAALSAFLNGIIITVYAVWRLLEWAIVS